MPLNACLRACETLGVLEMILGSFQSLHQHQFSYAAFGLKLLSQLPPSSANAERLYFALTPYLDIASTSGWDQVVKRLPFLLAFEKSRADPRFTAAFDRVQRLKSEKQTYGAAEACLACGSSGGKLLLCSRCKGVRFCDVACQKKAWPSHKTDWAKGQPVPQWLYEGSVDSKEEVDKALLECLLQCRVQVKKKRERRNRFSSFLRKSVKNFAWRDFVWRRSSFLNVRQRRFTGSLWRVFL
jgi:hypothetical protein